MVSNQLWDSPVSRFDCYSFNIPNRPEDEEGLKKAVKYIISTEVKDHKVRVVSIETALPQWLMPPMMIRYQPVPLLEFLF